MSTPTEDYTGTIFVAIELSQKTWLVTLHSPDQDRFSRHRFDGGDHGGLLALIEKVRARAAQKLGSVPRVVSRYEAGYDGFWLHRLLEAAGITNFVFDPASIAVEQRSLRLRDSSALPIRAQGFGHPNAGRSVAALHHVGARPSSRRAALRHPIEFQTVRTRGVVSATHVTRALRDRNVFGEVVPRPIVLRIKSCYHCGTSGRLLIEINACPGQLLSYEKQEPGNTEPRKRLTCQYRNAMRPRRRWAWLKWLWMKHPEFRETSGP